MSDRRNSVALKLNTDELHLLVTWGYAVRSASVSEFQDFGQQALLDKLKAFRDERLVLGGTHE